jgi:hypothetical protein
MSKQKYNAKIRAVASTLVLLLLSVGCATNEPALVATLDENTGVTVTTSHTPMLFSRETPGYGARARNYVNLGVIEVNRIGAYEYYLWLGIWSTDQVASLEERRDGFESIVIFADGEPLSLDLIGWTPDAIGTSEPAYLKPVAQSVDAYYPVTLDQIRMIAGAADVRLRATGILPKEFQPWNEQRAARSDLQMFLGQISQ